MAYACCTEELEAVNDCKLVGQGKVQLAGFANWDRLLAERPQLGKHGAVRITDTLSTIKVSLRSPCFDQDSTSHCSSCTARILHILVAFSSKSQILEDNLPIVLHKA
jgi:hypothetical protein